MQPRKLKLREKVSPYFEIGLAYFQYLSLIYEIDLPWPHAWNTFLQWTSISTLANAFDLTGHGTHAALDSRAHYLVITVLFPLGLSFIMLLFAKPLHILLWFFILLLGLGLLAAGVALVLLGIEGNGGTLARAGSGCIAACIILLGVWWFVRRAEWTRKANLLRQAMRERRAKRLRAAEEAAAEAAAKKAAKKAAKQAEKDAAEAAKAAAVSAKDASVVVAEETSTGDTASPAPLRGSGSTQPLLTAIRPFESVAFIPAALIPIAAPVDHPHMLPPPYAAATPPAPAGSTPPPPKKSKKPKKAPKRLQELKDVLPEQSMVAMPSYGYEGSVTHRVLDREKEEEKEAFQNVHKYIDSHAKPRGRMFFLTRLSLAVILIFAGITALGYIEYVPPQIVNSSFYTLRNVFGPILIGTGAVLFVYVLANCFHSGRSKIERVKAFLEGRFIWIMLLSLTTLYIPFTSTALGALRCVTLQCSQGFQPPVARRLFLDTVLAPPTFSKLTDGCQSCQFMGNCSLADALCRPADVSRLTMDLSQPCGANFPWMVPVTFITGLIITIGTPLLFYRLVVKHTRLLENIPAVGTEREKWEFRCSTTRNSAKMLYHGFTYKWRFYRLLLVIQRLAVSVFTIFLFKSPLFLVYLTMSVHLFFFLINLLVRPYRNLAVDGIAFGTGGGLVATCALGVALYSRSAASWGTGTVLAVDIGLPTLATLGMMYIERRRAARRVAPLEGPVTEAGAGVELGAAGATKEEQEKAKAEREQKEKEEKEKEEREREEAEKRPLNVVDHIINDFTLKTMSNFFMLAGVLAFLCLAIGIVGILYSNSQLEVVAPVTNTDGKAQDQFAGYTSWAEFTANCCCMSPTSDDKTVETWKCANGYYKERLRETTGRHKKTGYSVRSYCGYTFSSSVCGIPSTDTKFKAIACTGFSLDDFEAQYLW